MKTRVPSRYMASTISPNRTGLARWAPRRVAIADGSAGWGAASRLEYTGRSGEQAEQALDGAFKRLTCRGDHRGVERARDRQETAGDSTARGQVDRLAHSLSGPGDDRLPGPVPVGGEDIGNFTDQTIDIGTPGARAAIAPVWPAPASRIKRPRSLESSARAAAS